MPLTDLFIATEAEATGGDETLPPVPKRRSPTNDRIDIKGMHIASVATIWCILMGKPWRAPILDKFKAITDDDDSDGPWIHRLPQDLVDRLAALTKPQLPAIAKELLKGDKYLADLAARRSGIIVQMLADIVTLAKRGKAQGKGLYIWECL